MKQLSFEICNAFKVALTPPELEGMKWSMRSPWIKVEVSTPDKPEICAIASRLRIDEDAVVGKLIRLWAWAELNRIDPNDLSVTKVFLDKLVSKKGFADAMLSSGWLCQDGERLYFPNFEKHNGHDSKVRGLTAKRVERHRKSNSSTNGMNVSDVKKQAGKITKKPSKSVNENIVSSIPTSLSMDDLTRLKEDATSQNDETQKELQNVDKVQPVVNADVLAEELLVTPKKRQSNSNETSDDQPMLF